MMDLYVDIKYGKRERGDALRAGFLFKIFSFPLNIRRLMVYYGRKNHAARRETNNEGVYHV